MSDNNFEPNSGKQEKKKLEQTIIDIKITEADIEKVKKIKEMEQAAQRLAQKNKLEAKKNKNGFIAIIKKNISQSISQQKEFLSDKVDDIKNKIDHSKTRKEQFKLAKEKEEAEKKALEENTQQQSNDKKKLKDSYVIHWIKNEINIISERTGSVLYTLGYYSEQELGVVFNVISRICGIAWGFVWSIIVKLYKLFKVCVLSVVDIFVAPFWRINNGFKNMWQVINDEKEKGKIHTFKAVGVYFKRGVKDYSHLLTNLLLWLMTIGSLAVFVFVVDTVLSYQYALAVEYEGKTVGYVKDEQTYEAAVASVQDKIVYVDEVEDEWSITPEFRLAVSSEEELDDAEHMSNAILQASGAEIVEATGLYIDNNFYGATSDSLQLTSDLDALKAPYLSDDPEVTVEFAHDVELRDGIYLLDSVVDYSYISNLLSSEVQGERTYVVAQGDSPSKIAASQGVVLSDLYALNPQMENGNVLFVGMELTISQAEAFLPVLVVKTVTEIEEVPYAVNRTNTDDLLLGQTKVTSPGVNGQNQLQVQYVYQDGVLIERNVIESVTLSEPVTEEVLYGTYVSATVKVNPYSGGGIMCPVANWTGRMSRGWQGLYVHNGIDFLQGYGAPIIASADGVVTKAAYTNVGYGVHVMINHGSIMTVYGHMSSLAVSAGQYVERGQIIGYMGSTGNSTGTHLHFEVRVNGVAQDPMGFF